MIVCKMKYIELTLHNLFIPGFFNTVKRNVELISATYGDTGENLIKTNEYFPHIITIHNLIIKNLFVFWNISRKAHQSQFKLKTLLILLLINTYSTS